MGVISLRAKITLFAVVILLAASLVAGFVVFQTSARSFVEQQIAELAVEARVQGSALTATFDRIRRDARTLATTTATQGIVRARGNAGWDPVGEATATQWAQQLTTLMHSFAVSNTDYHRVRLLDGATRRSIVDVRREDGVLIDEVESGTPLWDPTFAAQVDAVRPGEIVISALRLHHNPDGSIAEGNIPVIRVAVPVFDSAGSLRAVSLLDWDVGPTLRGAAAGVPPGLEFRIATDAGDYVLHPDSRREFAFEFGSPYRIQDEFPELAAAGPGSVPGTTGRSFEAAREDGDHAVHELRVQVDAPSDRSVRLVLSSPYSTILSQANEMRRRGVLVALPILTVCAGFVFVLSWLLTRQLAEFTQTADAVAGGQYDVELPVERRDEFGVLARSMRTMVDQVVERTSALEAAKERQESDFAILRDALERARRSAEDANRAKSQFLANMSHELRTPLSAILGFAEMLLEDAVESGNAQAANDLETILDAGRHLLSLINQVLDLSKIETGYVERFDEEIDGDALVDEVVTTIAPLVAHNDNTLDLACESLGSFVADSTKLKQILLNILANSCKFTSGGTIRLYAERQRGFERDVVRFEISDTGIGMTPEELARVFRPFSQADSSTTRRFGGTGLGLALSREYCRLMGGEIHAESAEGAGSSFGFWIPLDPSLDPDAPEHAGLDVTGSSGEPN